MVLKRNQETDYTFTLEGGSCWITVGNISVYIIKGDDGVSVALYPAGSETSDSIAETWATYGEAENDEDN